MRRRLLIILCPLLVGGCALPLPLQLATWTAEGISYWLTSKSVSDHGLSAAVGRDCAVHRAVTEGAICREDAGDGTAIASSEGAPETPGKPAPRDTKAGAARGTGPEVGRAGETPRRIAPLDR